MQLQQVHQMDSYWEWNKENFPCFLCCPFVSYFAGPFYVFSHESMTCVVMLFCHVLCVCVFNVRHVQTHTLVCIRVFCESDVDSAVCCIKFCVVLIASPLKGFYVMVRNFQSLYLMQILDKENSSFLCLNVFTL